MKSITNPDEFFDHYTALIRKRFAGQPLLADFLFEMTMAFEWTKSNYECHYFISPDGCVVIYKTHATEGNFGFFVIPKASDEAQQLWDAAKNKASEIGCETISGPIQGTTFFAYRFIKKSDGTPFFKGEYFSDISDDLFMMTQGPRTTNSYLTGRRDYYDGIMEVSKPYYDNAVEKGFEIKKYTEVDARLFKEVFELIGSIFGSNWSFSNLSEAELQGIFQHEFGAKSRLVLHTYHLGGEMIGFCRFVENDENTLICKTLGILPEYQKLGLGNAAVYEFHKDAKELGYSQMYYALIYEGNRVRQNMPKDDAEYFRYYASYEFEC